MTLAEGAMRNSNLLVKSGLLAVALSAALTGCSSAGDLNFSNEGPNDVTISTGSEKLTVAAWGAVSILGSGCSQGDIIVEFSSGQKVVIAGPICPSEQVVIHASTVDLQPS